MRESYLDESSYPDDRIYMDEGSYPNEEVTRMGVI